MRLRTLLLVVMLLSPLLCCDKSPEFVSLPKGVAGRDAQSRGLPAPCEEPQHVQTIRQAGDIHNEAMERLAAGDLDKAAQYFQAALDLIPTFADARLNLGMVRLKQGRVPEAIAIFDRLIGDMDDWADAYAARGQAHLSQKDYLRARNDFIRAITHDRSRPDFWLNLAVSLEGQGLPQDEERCLLQAMQVIPGNPDLAAFLANLYQGRGQMAQARQVVADAAARFPDSGPLWLARARLALADQDFDAALAALDTAQRNGVPPDNLHAYYGATYRGLNRLDESVAAFSRGMDARPQDSYLVQDYAKTLADAGRYEELGRLLDRPLRLDPASQFSVEKFRGMAHQSAGRPREAASSYRAAIALVNAMDEPPEGLRYERDALVLVVQRLDKGLASSTPLPLSSVEIIQRFGNQ